MSQKSPSPNDLNALIQQAQTEVAHQTRRQPAHVPVAQFRTLLGIFLVGLILGAIYLLWMSSADPTPEHVAHDLEAVLEQARETIEKSRAETGQLPEALPNASLASVVRYDRDQNQYQLSATIMGIRVTLSPDGKKTTEKGIRE